MKIKLSLVIVLFWLLMIFHKSSEKKIHGRIRCTILHGMTKTQQQRLEEA